MRARHMSALFMCHAVSTLHVSRCQHSTCVDGSHLHVITHTGRQSISQGYAVRTCGAEIKLTVFISAPSVRTRRAEIK